MRALATTLPLLALCWLVPAVALAEVRVDVQTDKKALSIDDTLTLRITVQAEGAGSPEVELPELAGFEVLSQQVQRPMQFSFNFGQQATFRSSSIYTFVLRPTQIGALQIAPVRVQLEGQTYTTQPVTIRVSAGSSGAPPQGSQPDDPTQPADPAQQQNTRPGAQTTDPSGMVSGAQFDRDAFLRTIVDQAQPYVGQQVTVTVYLYMRERLRNAPAIDQEPTADGFWTRDLMPVGQQLKAQAQVVNNTRYAVYALRRFAAFPLRPGELTIGPMALTIDTSSLFDMLGSGRRQPNLQRTGVPVVLQVQPLPEAQRPVGPVAVGTYSIQAKLDRAETATGDAVTLTALVRGRGNIETVELASPAVPGLDILQPTTKDMVETPQDLVTGTREYRWLIVPRRPGRFTLPPFVLETFDPATRRYHRVESPPLALEAVGTALASAPAPSEPSGDAAPTPIDTGAVEWAPIRTHSALTRRATLAAEHGLYPFALALPPLVWLLISAGAWMRRRAAARTLGPGERAAREANEQQSAAEQAARQANASAYHAAAARAITAQLESRLGESVVSLTHDQLRRELQARAMDDALIDTIIEQLRGADFARFASGDSDEQALAGQVAALRALLGRLRTFEPTEGAP